MYKHQKKKKALRSKDHFRYFSCYYNISKAQKIAMLLSWPHRNQRGSKGRGRERGTSLGIGGLKIHGQGHEALKQYTVVAATSLGSANRGRGQPLFNSSGHMAPIFLLFKVALSLPND